MYRDGAPPPEPEPSDHDGLRRLWLRGLDLYDHRYYWEAHEAWEACWHHTPPGPRRLLQQGLIQGAAAVLKRHLGHQRAMQRLQQAAADKLAAVGVPTLDGVDVAATRAALLGALARTDGWPRIVDAGAR